MFYRGCFLSSKIFSSIPAKVSLGERSEEEINCYNAIKQKRFAKQILSTPYGEKAGEDFERSLDEFTDGLEKMFDSLEGILDVALKK